MVINNWNKKIPTKAVYLHDGGKDNTNNNPDTDLGLRGVLGLNDANLLHLGIGDKTGGVQYQSCARDLHRFCIISVTSQRKIYDNISITGVE